MIAIIRGCGCNIASLQFALNRLGVESVLTDDAEVIGNASKVILPGVGAAGKAMHSLQSLSLLPVIKSLRQPVLGICLGMQLLYEFSEEDDTPGLGLIPGTITKLASGTQQPIPHMGWNNLQFSDSEHHLADEVASDPYAYFVHSYAAPLGQHTIASCHYTETFSAIVQHQNFTGMQFHPERSGKIGERLLLNFIEWGSYANHSSN